MAAGEPNFVGIINGDLAYIEDFPYYAFIAKDDRLHCGGAFIERDLVLTAAHCLKDDDIVVYPGITETSDLETKKGYEVKEVVPHPDYLKFGGTDVDIGLIRLRRKIKLGGTAQLIELAEEAPFVDEKATVVGFGAMKCKGRRCKKSKKRSKHLRSASLTIDEIRDDGTLVTTSRGNKNTCYGDSGSPVIYEEKVVGVVSSGEYSNCTGYDEQSPVFTMLDWIEETKDEI
ncbi:hypothetical protein Trydic_g20572 [Trypoxylus dichotomus]